MAGDVGLFVYRGSLVQEESGIGFWWVSVGLVVSRRGGGTLWRWEVRCGGGRYAVEVGGKLWRWEVSCGGGR